MSNKVDGNIFHKAINSINKSILISSAVASFVIGIPLTMAGAIMLNKANKTGEGKTGWVVMLVFGILFLICGIGTSSGAATLKEEE